MSAAARDYIWPDANTLRNYAEDSKYELQQKDKEIESTQDLADMDSKHIMQQMKHLQFENHSKLGEVRAEALTQLKVAQEHHVMQEMELQSDKRQLRRMVRERIEMSDMQHRQLESHFNQQLLWVPPNPNPSIGFRPSKSLILSIISDFYAKLIH